MPLYAPIGRGIAPKCPYTSANAPMPAQMPLCPALAGGGTQMPLYTRENAPTCPAGKTTRLSLIFLIYSQ